MIERVERFFEPGWEVWRKTIELDDSGAVLPDPWVIIMKLEGRLRPLSSSLRLSSDKETYFGSHRFYCFPTDILEGDQLRRGTERYEVKGAHDMMDMDRFMQIDCEVVR